MHSVQIWRAQYAFADLKRGVQPPASHRLTRGHVAEKDAALALCRFRRLDQGNGD